MRELGLALDAAAAGRPPWRQLARQAALRSQRVAGLEPAAYGGSKDASAAWAAGVLAVGGGPAGLGRAEDLQEVCAERVAIMVAAGGVPHAAAERLVWGCLAPYEPGYAHNGGAETEQDK